MRGVWSRKRAYAAAKELQRILPNPVPGKDPSGRVWAAADPVQAGLGCGFQPIILARRPHLVQHHG